MKANIKTTPIPFNAKKHERYLGIGFKIIQLSKHYMIPSARLCQAVVSYAPWVGLAEALDWTAQKKLEEIIAANEHWKALDTHLKNIVAVRETHELDPDHPYSLLCANPYLVPSFLSLGLQIGKVTQQNDTRQSPAPKPMLNALKLASVYNRQPAERDTAESSKMPIQVNQAIKEWLYPMETELNVSVMRQLLGLMGCRLIADFSNDRLEQLSRHHITHPLAGRKTGVQEGSSAQVGSK